VLDYFIIALVISGIICALLLAGNLKKKERGFQVPDVLLAIILVSASVLFIKYIITPVLNLFSWILGIFGVTFVRGSIFANILFILFIILLYSVFKLILKYFLIKKIYPFLYSHFKRISFPYIINPDGEFLISGEWSFLKTLSKSVIWIALPVYLAFLVLSLLLPSPLNIPPFLVFSIFVLIEIFFYLNGNIKILSGDKVTGEDARFGRIINFDNLWEDYQKIWPDKILLANRYMNPSPEIKTDNILNQDDAMLLKARGFKINFTDQDILDQAINKDCDIIVNNIILEKFAPVLTSIVNHKLIEGRNVLILLPTHDSLNEKTNYAEYFLGWFNEWLIKINGDVDHWSAQYFHKLEDSNPDICNNLILSTADHLLDKKTLGNTWFDELGLVIVFYTLDDFQSNLVETKTLLRILEKSKRSIQLVALSNEYRNLQDSIEQNLELRLKKSERSYLYTTPEQSIYSLFWKAEGSPSYHSRVFAGDPFEHIDIEALIALLCTRPFIDHAEVINNGRQTLEESCEELVRKREHILQDILEITDINSYQQKIRIPVISDIVATEPEKVLFVRDRENNLITSYRKWTSFGENDILLNIISLPYLLREYLIGNFDFFSKSPLYPVSPKLFQNEFNSAIEILFKLLIGRISSEDILKIIQRVRPETKHSQELFSLLRKEFNIDENRFKLYLKSSEEFEFIHEDGKDMFKSVRYYELDYSIMSSVKDLWFLRRVKIIDNSGSIIKETDYDHLYQDYLPGQIVSINGRPYKIKNFNENSFTLDAEFLNSERFFLFYRNKLEVGIDKIREIRAEEKDIICKSLLTVKFSVHTHGYYQFLTNYSNIKTDYAYYPLRNIPVRNYLNGRALAIEIDSMSYDSQNVRLTIVLLLNELMKTLFPFHHNYLIIGTEDLEIPEDYDFVFTRLSSKESDVNLKKSGKLRLLFLEDSVKDIGLISSIFDNIDYIFKIIDDYISWQMDTSSKTPPINPLVKNESRRSNIEMAGFLKFGNSNIPEFIDFKNSHWLLSDILKQNELTQARNDFYSGKKRYNLSREEENICDFCGRESVAGSLDVFEDGRQRCQACRESAIDTLEELESIYAKCRESLIAHFKLDLVSGIRVRFTDAKDIQNSLGSVFVPTPGFDPRAVGLATIIDGIYTIYIENGAPMISTYACIIHELTHIWQFSKLNMQKLEKETSNILSEGHAVWTSIQILRKNEYLSEADNYHNYYLKSQDEYGTGYRILLEKCVGKTPFEYLLDVYPKQ
jgi:hypothetical protein